MGTEWSVFCTGNTTTEDGSGLSAAQAAALGLSHAAAPGAGAVAAPPGAPPARALLPAHAHAHPALHHPPHHHPAADLPTKFSKVYLDGTYLTDHIFSFFS